MTAQNIIDAIVETLGYVTHEPTVAALRGIVARAKRYEVQDVDEVEARRMEEDKAILDWLEAHRNCVPSYDPGDPEVGVPPCWSVDKHVGKPGENLWETIAFGTTMREAVINAKHRPVSNEDSPKQTV
jgi:hypothetical protein